VGDATENVDDLAPHAPCPMLHALSSGSLRTTFFLKTSSQMIPLSAERDSLSRLVAGLAAIVSRAVWLFNMNLLDELGWANLAWCSRQ